jgi:hypothetical protein
MRTTYLVIDRHTGRVVGKCKTLRAARLSVDKRDNAYGAYRYFVQVTNEPIDCNSWR